MTHVYEVWLPFRSLTMRGSEVDTTVDERIATSMPISRPDRAVRTSRWLMPGASPGSWGAAGFVPAAVGVCDKVGSVVVLR
jgi:hypothetical protein